MTFSREIQAQEALQNGQLGSGEGIPDLQPGVLASQAMIEKTLTEDPRWQGEWSPLSYYLAQEIQKQNKHFYVLQDERRKETNGLNLFSADTNFVLANYKTDQCTKPPRLCRQGYACPHYHNSRDRRRNPRKFKYR